MSRGGRRTWAIGQEETVAYFLAGRCSIYPIITYADKSPRIVCVAKEAGVKLNHLGITVAESILLQADEVIR